MTARPWVIATIEQLFNKLKSESEMQVAVQYKVVTLSSSKLDQLAGSIGLNIKGDNFSVASQVVDAITQKSRWFGWFSSDVLEVRCHYFRIGQNVISEGQFIGLPNRIMPINLTTQSYISGIETEQNNPINTSTRSITTNEIKTGLSMLILPKVLDDGQFNSLLDSRKNYWVWIRR